MTARHGGRARWQDMMAGAQTCISVRIAPAKSQKSNGSAGGPGGTKSGRWPESTGEAPSNLVAMVSLGADGDAWLPERPWLAADRGQDVHGGLGCNHLGQRQGYQQARAEATRSLLARKNQTQGAGEDGLACRVQEALEAHEKEIDDIEFSPDNNKVSSAGAFKPSKILILYMING